MKKNILKKHFLRVEALKKGKMHIYVKYNCLKAKTISLRVFKIIDFINIEYEITKGTLRPSIVCL